MAMRYISDFQVAYREASHTPTMLKKPSTMLITKIRQMVRFIDFSSLCFGFCYFSIVFTENQPFHLIPINKATINRRIPVPISTAESS